VKCEKGKKRSGEYRVEVGRWKRERWIERDVKTKKEGEGSGKKGWRESLTITSFLHRWHLLLLAVHDQMNISIS